MLALHPAPIRVPPGVLDLPRDEMAFRKRYQPLLLTRRLTTVFRPGDRRYPAWRGYAPGETVCARVIEICGSDRLGVPPVFNALRIPIRIETVEPTPVARLRPDDFRGSSPDVQDRRTLEAHLQGIYGRPLSAYGDLVTVIRFAYVGSAQR